MFTYLPDFFGSRRPTLSDIATHLLHVVRLVGATATKKAQDSVVSNRIGMKFGRNVPPVNVHRMTKSDFELSSR